MEMNWKDMQVSKTDTNNKRSCSQVSYRMVVLKVSKNYQESTSDGATF